MRLRRPTLVACCCLSKAHGSPTFQWQLVSCGGWICSRGLSPSSICYYLLPSSLIKEDGNEMCRKQDIWWWPQVLQLPSWQYFPACSCQDWCLPVLHGEQDMEQWSLEDIWICQVLYLADCYLWGCGFIPIWQREDGFLLIPMLP